jgi:hypothetical protein
MEQDCRPSLLSISELTFLSTILIIFKNSTFLRSHHQDDHVFYYHLCLNPFTSTSPSWFSWAPVPYIQFCAE